MSAVRVACVGRGNVGGGLGDLWARAGHEVTRLGRDGGDVSDAAVVLLAVPGAAVPAVMDTVTGWPGQTVIDATNLMGNRPPEGMASNAEFVQSRTHGPTVKSFNANFMALLGRIGEARARPGNVWCGDEEARQVVEQLIRDAGYEPLYAGGLDKAPAMENFARLLIAMAQAGLGPFFYRMAPPEQL
jgi:predicted dinucleotide-binding enzyme